MSLKRLSLLIWASMPLALWADGEVGGSAAGLSLPSERVVSSVMARDEKTFANLQQRISLLNSERGVAINSYALAKAQAWWDLANAEYRMNDRSDYVRAVLAEVERLLVLMESDKPADLTRVEPKPSKPLREDMWRAVAELKAASAFACAEANTARLEVMLAGAGHDYDELGWRHALPRVAMAERLLKLAKNDLDDEACKPKPEPVPEPVQSIEPVAELAPAIVQDSPVCVPLPAPTPEPTVKIFADRVHFAFASDSLSLRSQELLMAWIELLRSQPDLAVDLIGHTDMQGMDGLNEKLSARRVLAVREFFMAAGISPKRLLTQAQGKRAPTSLQAAENRRVELRLRGDIPGIRLQRQQQDVQ